MVLDDMVEVRRSHLEQILVEEFATKGRLWHCNRRVQKPGVMDSLGTPVARDQATVRTEHTIQVQE
jgi:hypothetical protein